ncbi:MAG: sensor histidine kinase [Chitinophagales bacterium]
METADRNARLVYWLREKRLWLHLAFWAVFAVTYSFGLIGSRYSWRVLVLDYFGTLGLYASFIYACLYVVYAPLARRGKVLAALAVFAVLLVAATQATAALYWYTYDARNVTLFNFMPFYCFLAALALALKVARETYLNLWQALARQKELADQKEYFLRSQIHPHFLFNTLNNFYGLALAHSNQLPDLMIKLSNILRHQIYDAGKAQVPLQKEIDYLKDYIELETIRHGSNLSFQFSFPEAVPANITVPPSLFIVFFENAFKHSQDLSSRPIVIQGAMRIAADGLHFHLENTVAEGVDRRAAGSSGLGLANVKSRIDLMGADRCKLQIDSQPKQFAIHLQMKLE